MKKNVLLYLIISSLFITISCYTDNTTTKKKTKLTESSLIRKHIGVVELTDYSNYLIKNYLINLEKHKKSEKEFYVIISIGKFKDGNRIQIYNVIDYCLSDYNYLSKYEDRDVFISGEHDSLFFKNKIRYKKIKYTFCDTNLYYNYCPSVWEFVYNDSSKQVILAAYINENINIDSFLKEVSF